MQEFYLLLKNTNHNIFLVEGNDDTYKELSYLFQKEESSNKNETEYIYLKYLYFKIDDSRYLLDIFKKKPKEFDRLIFVRISFFSKDAQQLLLKFLEELNSDTKIIFIIDWIDQVIDTIKSRSLLFNNKNQNLISKDFDFYYKLTLKQKKEYIEQYIPKKDEDKDVFRIKIINFFDDFLFYLLSSKKGKINYPDVLSLRKMRKFLFNPGSSIKMIMELFIVLF